MKVKNVILAAAAVAAAGLGGTAIAGATGGGGSERDGDEAVSDRAVVERASESALQAAGGGKVTEVEVADEGDRGYEVGVQRADGSFVEVRLGTDFRAVSVQADDAGD